MSDDQEKKKLADLAAEVSNAKFDAMADEWAEDIDLDALIVSALRSPEPELSLRYLVLEAFVTGASEQMLATMRTGGVLEWLMEGDEIIEPLTLTPLEDGGYQLTFPWPAPNPPATYSIEAREVGSAHWYINSVTTATVATWSPPRLSPTGWEIRVTAQTQKDGEYHSDVVVVR